MNQINVDGKIIQLKCCKCGDTNGPFIGGDIKKLYCEKCHNEMILRNQRKNKGAFKVDEQNKPLKRK